VLGITQVDPNTEKKVFGADSSEAVVFVSPEWLFSDKDSHVKVSGTKCKQ